MADAIRKLVKRVVREAIMEGIKEELAKMKKPKKISKKD